MSKIKILAIPSDKHGVGKFRIMDPYTFIGEKHSDDVHVDITFNAEDNDEYFLNYDIVVFHSFIHQTTHDSNVNRIKWLKSKGIKVIMDIDDLWFVDQRHPMYHQIKASRIGEMKIEMMRLVDAITTTTSIFAKTIMDRLGVKNVQIFPNAVNEDESQFQVNTTKSDKVRFGWLGGSSHLHDLELMSNGISSTHYSFKDKAQFVLCGFDLRGTVTEMAPNGEKRQRPIQPLETVWYKYENIFTDNGKLITPEYQKFLDKFKEEDDSMFNDEFYHRVWTRPVQSYAKNYAKFDVSLAPIMNHMFNRVKSQLKVIEAGFYKKAIVASNIGPYTIDLKHSLQNGNFVDGNAILVDEKRNHADWAKAMKKLIQNPTWAADLGERLYETVKDKYDLNIVTDHRAQLYKSLK